MQLHSVSVHDKTCPSLCNDVDIPAESASERPRIRALDFVPAFSACPATRPKAFRRQQ